MGYTIKQKIEICLQSEAHPQMTQIDLAHWAMQKYGTDKPPSQTTISRILSSKNEIIRSKEADFALVRRRKQTNPLLRKILTEWITQALWERIPITTPIIQLTANAIWTRLPQDSKDGNGVFNHKWCNHFVKKLNINLEGSPAAVAQNLGYTLDHVWKLDEKLDLKTYIHNLIHLHNYSPRDLFTIDEFQLFYALPLDQIFDISSIDKGLKQCNSSTENMLTIMLGCNADGSEKLTPLVVSRNDTFDVSTSSHSAFKSANPLTATAIENKINEAYQISYKSNSNKWITSSMFQDYLLTLDHKLESVSPHRNIVIFLDNSSSHRMINLEFQHIKLCYLENASRHRNPYNGAFNGVRFDYLPMSFGIVEEFKILYRLQQYLEMINQQRSLDPSLSPLSTSSSLSKLRAHDSEVLQESDYHVPFIKVIEWIKRSWNSIGTEKIFLSWKQASLINFKNPWPASDARVAEAAKSLLGPLVETNPDYNPLKSYEKLQEIMKYLNVVIPWEIDELLGLVNERSKVSLDYVSIEEIIGSCVLGPQNEDYGEKQITQSEPWYDDSQDNFGFKPSRMIPSPDIPSPAIPSPAVASPALLSPTHLPKMEPQQTILSQQMMPPQPLLQRPNPLSPMNLDFGGSLNMNALLMATNVAKNPDLANYGTTLSPIVPKPEMSLPVLARVDNPLYLRDRKHRLSSSSDFNTFLVDRKRPSTFGPVPPFFSPIGSTETPLDGYEKASANSPAANSPMLFKAFGEFRSPPRLRETTPNDSDLVSLLHKVIDASNTDELKLSNFALEELKSNLSKMQHKDKN